MIIKKKNRVECKCSRVSIEITVVDLGDLRTLIIDEAEGDESQMFINVLMYNLSTLFTAD